jgi:flagellin FlaB
MHSSSSSDPCNLWPGLSESGFTGLEAAIVLIAFVVVAAIFSFTVLQLGFLSTQDTQSAIHQGIQQSGSSCTVMGTVYGVSTTPNRVDFILVPVGLTAGGEPVDATTISIRYVSAHHIESLMQNDPLIKAYPARGRWSVQETLNDDGDALLEAGEQFVINVSPQSLTGQKPNGAFTIEIKPAERAPLRVARTIPGTIDKITRLD